MSFKLTTQQKDVVKGLLAWANNPKAAPMATLTGFAGVGKTTVLKYFLDEYKYKVAVTAPTHKAVFVASTILNRRGQTLHKLHGLRPNVNLASFDINNVQFDPLGKPSIAEFALLIVDEASMINKSLAKLNNDRATMFEVKVLFVGDKYQLPPIGERYSSVFDLPTKFELTEVLRQSSNNPINKVLPLLRADIDSNQTWHGLNYILNNQIAINLNDGIKEGYALLGNTDFTTKMLSEFGAVFKGKIIKYLSGTNEDVIGMNAFIRNNFISNGDLIVEGDLLTANTNTYDEYQGLMLTNSSDYVVDGVDYIKSDYDFMIYVCNLRNTTTGELIPPIKIVDNFNSEGWKEYKEALEAFYITAINSSGRNRGKNWGLYYDFKKQYLQMIKVDFGRGKVVDRDISYGYASTVHKSQGSTYDITFTNLANIALTKDGKYKRNHKWQPYNIEYTNKLIYVALSRAIEKNILLWV